jgi:tungstate transport system ATP-binding protein
MYQLSQLTKTYNGRTVLSIDQLTIQKGEVLTILGPSGAGKSTLLRILNFLESPSSGEIRFMGHSWQDHSSVPLEIRRQVTTVFQRPILISRGVQENIALGLRWRKQPTSEVSKVLAQVGLEHLAKHPAQNLSGGEAQRVALARAIVLKPAVLLLDEPTANLDPANARIIEKIILQLNQEKNTTIVLVTHNIFQARRLGQRIALILDGQIVEIGAAEAIFNSPVDERTRAFIHGDMTY